MWPVGYNWSPKCYGKSTMKAMFLSLFKVTLPGEKHVRQRFFYKNGKSLLLYSFKANVLTNWHEKASICKLQNHIRTA